MNRFEKKNLKINTHTYASILDISFKIDLSVIFQVLMRQIIWSVFFFSSLKANIISINLNKTKKTTNKKSLKVLLQTSNVQLICS